MLILKKGDEITIKIEKMKYPNIGIGFYNDKKVHVKNVLEGQTIRCRISKNRSEKREARLLEIIENSPMEQSSFCEHYGLCGGCLFQTLSGEGQLQTKYAMVKLLFDEAGTRNSLLKAYCRAHKFLSTVTKWSFHLVMRLKRAL